MEITSFCIHIIHLSLKQEVLENDKRENFPLMAPILPLALVNVIKLRCNGPSYMSAKDDNDNLIEKLSVYNVIVTMLQVMMPCTKRLGQELFHSTDSLYSWTDVC